MSFIHAHKHEAPGLLAGIIDLYLPLQEINHPSEFTANPGDILLGGGSGEFPGWVIDPHVAVDLLMDQLFSGQSPNSYNPEAVEELTKVGLDTEELDLYVDFLEAIAPVDKERNTWAGWAGDDWHHIVNKAIEKGYERRKFGNIETWLLQEVGAWVLQEQPELLTVEFDETGQKFLQAAKALLAKQEPKRGTVEAY